MRGRSVVRRFEGPYFLLLQGFLLHSSAPVGEGPAVFRSAGKRPGTQRWSSEDLNSHFHISINCSGNITWKLKQKNSFFVFGGLHFVVRPRGGCNVHMMGRYFPVRVLCSKLLEKF
jgi:hypothetical protein